MDRAIPCGSKICAQRVEERRRALHQEKLRVARPVVDTSEPSVSQMEHVRLNLKREQMLEERYSEIDRENRCLLKKMSDIVKQQPTPVKPAGPLSLNRDARKKELLRITKENQSILKRIQKAQPVYNHVEWEATHKREQSYLKNCAEYPLVLRTPRTPGASSELVPLAPEAAEPSSGKLESPSPSFRGPQSARRAVDDEVRYVLKEGHEISGQYFLVEMATDGRLLNISAYNGDSQQGLELVVREKQHRHLYREANGDYSAIARKLRIDRKRLVLDDGGGGAPASQKEGQPPPLPQAAPAPGHQQQRMNETGELSADAMVVKTGSAGSGVSAGSFDAEIALNSAGDPTVRLHGLTPYSTGPGFHQPP